MTDRGKKIIHERHTKSGKPDRDYIHGRFLGKVFCFFTRFLTLFREVLPNVMNLPTLNLIRFMQQKLSLRRP